MKKFKRKIVKATKSTTAFRKVNKELLKKGLRLTGEGRAIPHSFTVYYKTIKRKRKRIRRSKR